MDFDWMRIAQAGLLIMFIVALYPAFKWWSANSPKAERGDWPAALLAIGGVVLFVLLLMSLVR
jgi:hypothetical protein